MGKGCSSRVTHSLTEMPPDIAGGELFKELRAGTLQLAAPRASLTAHRSLSGYHCQWGSACAGLWAARNVTACCRPSASANGYSAPAHSLPERVNGPMSRPTEGVERGASPGGQAAGCADSHADHQQAPAMQAYCRLLPQHADSRQVIGACCSVLWCVYVTPAQISVRA